MKKPHKAIGFIFLMLLAIVPPRTRAEIRYDEIL